MEAEHGAHETVFRAVPILRIFNETKAIEFYCGWLGFEIDWEHRSEADSPLYLQVSRGGMALHLTEHHGDCTPGSTVFVPTDGIRAFHEEIIARGYRFNRPGLDPAPWGGLVLEVIDPFSNRLRFWEGGSS